MGINKRKDKGRSDGGVCEVGGEVERIDLFIQTINILKHFFFNLDADILEASQKVFKVLGTKKKEILEGDSSHVLEGVYYWYSVFGIGIKLEYNSYDYDDKYRYMLTVKQDVLSKGEFDEKTVHAVANIVGTYLAKFLNGVINV